MSEVHSTLNIICSQDAATNPAATLTLEAVTNNSTADTLGPVLSTAIVPAAGTSLVLTYDEALDPASLPATGDFSIGTDGPEQTVTGVVAIAGTAVT